MQYETITLEHPSGQIITFEVDEFGVVKVTKEILLDLIRRAMPELKEIPANPQTMGFKRGLY